MIGTIEKFILPEYVFLHDLFDGYHSSEEINASMPDIPITIMKPEEIEYFEQDENTQVIAMHVEDLKDGRAFAEVAQRVSKKKPVIVLKALEWSIATTRARPFA